MRNVVYGKYSSFGVFDIESYAAVDTDYNCSEAV